MPASGCVSNYGQFIFEVGDLVVQLTDECRPRRRLMKPSQLKSPLALGGCQRRDQWARGLKYASTSRADTAANVEGIHFGSRSLSMT